MSGSISATQPTITFSEIPASPGLQTPGDWIEVKAGYNNIGILPFPARNLIIGQKTAAGTATVLTVYPNITDKLTARALAGTGSMLDRAVTAHLAANQTVPVDIIAVADAGGSVAAVWTRVFTAAATANGTWAENICGTRVTFGVTAGDATTVLATNYAAAINAVTTLPVTATVTTSTVTITARNAGLCGNDFNFLLNPLPGDTTPAGVTNTFTNTVVGATNPTLASIIAVMSQWYTDVLLPWNDSANLLAASAEAERRFTATARRDVRWHYGFNGTLAQSLSNAFTANARFLYQTPFNGPGSEPYCIAASMMGVASVQALNDPSLQLKGLALPGVVGPVYANGWQDYTSQNALLTGGSSVFLVNATGGINAWRYVSTYTQNAAGLLDPAWHDIMEAAVATRIRYDWRVYRGLVWGGQTKLARDTDLAAQTNATICTPRRMKASWAARCRTYAAQGWIVDIDNQIPRAQFVINASDPNRLDEQLFYTRIGNLMIDAGQIVFNVGR